MIRRLLTLYFVLCFLSLSAQKIHLVESEKPLNQLLIEMREKYALKFSFDDKLLARIKVRINKKFSSPAKALEYLLRQNALTYQLQDGVYVIYPAMALSTKSSSVGKWDSKISGSISDKTSGETLPNASVLINGYNVSCDEMGRFTFISANDSVFGLRISHLGYLVKDTLVKSGMQHKFQLIPASYKIKEVTVVHQVEKSLRTTELPGVIRANNLIANNLPGNGNASVFNFLRLMPGFLASGEQSQSMLIWGCYEGQSQLSVDGYTLFGLKNFNDNISPVNPYIVKDIKLLKGGYGAQYGGRVGGMVDITGIDGNTYKPEVKVNLNNLTVNAMASTPVGKNLSLTGAFRQTFYNLYDIEKLNPFRGDNHSTTTTSRTNQSLTAPNQQSGNDFQPNNASQKRAAAIEQPGNNTPSAPTQSNTTSVYLYPDYMFRDGNLKLSGRTNGGDSYFVSMYGGLDKFDYSLKDSINNSPYNFDANQKSTQWGASSGYNKLWQNGNRTAFNVAYSFLDVNAQTTNNLSSPGNESGNSKKENIIREYKIQAENYFTLSEKHSLVFGGGITGNSYNYDEILNSKAEETLKNDVQLLNGYATDQIYLNRSLTLKPGLRFDYSFLQHQMYWQPRISMNYQICDALKTAFSWGKYNQFIAKNYVVDKFGNYQMAWMVSDGERIPVPAAYHWVAGGYFNKSGFSASVEGYYKSIDGLYRVARSQGQNPGQSQTKNYYGQGRSAGVDFLVKQQYGRHYAWVSYSLSKTDEFFPDIMTKYQSAPQDQRQELKSAVILDFKRWICSANYVYGSGFPEYMRNLELSSAARNKYNRFDISLSYRLAPKRFNMQTGFSILNLFDTDNVKMSGLFQNSGNSVSSEKVLSIYSHTIPFTPMLYFELSF